MLETYQQFLDYGEKVGFLALMGKFIDHFPKVDTMTREEQWHTGSPDTDPWQWKSRAAREKRLAFGSILGGTKGFVSREWYPVMVAACRPRKDIHSRYGDGLVSRSAHELYKLFAPGAVLSTSDIRRELNVAKGKGLSAVDAAVVTLQREYLITICGDTRKVGKDAKEYGWPINTFCRVEDWVEDWQESFSLSREEARERILDHIETLGDIHRGKLEKALFGKLP